MVGASVDNGNSVIDIIVLIVAIIVKVITILNIFVVIGTYEIANPSIARPRVAHQSPSCQSANL